MKPAQLLAGTDWQPAATKADSAQIVVRHALKLGIIALSLEFGPDVRSGGLGHTFFVTGAVSPPVGNWVGDRSSHQGAGNCAAADLRPVKDAHAGCSSVWRLFHQPMKPQRAKPTPMAPVVTIRADATV